MGECDQDKDPGGSGLVEQLKQAAAAIAEQDKADVFLISGQLIEPADTRLIDCVGEYHKCPNVLVLVTTIGGSASVAYRMARCLRRTYKEVNLLVIFGCKSAGTLFALGADTVIMADEAHLGPLDVQIQQPDELGAVISGLTPVHALEFLQEKSFELWEKYFLELISRSGGQFTTRTAAEIAARLTTGHFGEIYRQLDPIRLGEYHRNMRVAQRYGERLVCDPARKGVLEHLIYGYPSHDFVIDREEADDLFGCVRKLTERERNLAQAVEEIIRDDCAKRVAVTRYVDAVPKPEGERQEGRPVDESLSQTGGSENGGAGPQEHDASSHGPKSAEHSESV